MNNLITPKDFFGFEPGTEGEMADWSMLFNYYKILEKNSDRIIIDEMGETPGKNIFPALIISSPDNLKNIDKYFEISLKLSQMTEENPEIIEKLAASGKAIVVSTMSIHAHEVGGAQAAPLIVHRLLDSNEPEITTILENVIFILFPSANPDGLNVEADWYSKYKNTHFTDKYSCCVLYHEFAGHGNNRDSIHENLMELQCINDYLYRKCHANIQFDVHHTYYNEHRMILSAPAADPIREELSPLLIRELAFFGTGICCCLEEENIPDIVYRFDDIPGDEFADNGYFHMHQAPKYHNIIGILSENAHLLKGLNSQYLKAEDCSPKGCIPSVTNPHPWEGGIWSLEKLLNQISIATLATLKLAAQNKHMLLANTATKAIRQTERGRESSEQGYFIPMEQHDISALYRFIDILDKHRIKYYRTAEDFVTGEGVLCPANSIYIPLAQPDFAMVSLIMKKRIFPDNRYTRRKDNTFLVSDTASSNIAEWMGVKVYPALREVDIRTESFEKNYHGIGSLPAPVENNDSYKLVNKYLNNKKQVWINGNQFCTTPSKIEITPRKIALFMPHIDGCVDDAPYTNLFLKNFGFEYEIIDGKDIRKGILEKFDTLILPAYHRERYEIEDYLSPNETTENQWAFGHYGLKQIDSFVKNGGRIISWTDSCDYLIENLKLPVKNLTSGMPLTEYQVQFSTLNVTCLPDVLTTGMPENTTILHSEGPCFVSENNFLCKPFVQFKASDILSSGVLVGENVIAGKYAAVQIKQQNGDVILYSFSPQFRFQTDGQFKLFLNALYNFNTDA